MIKALKKEFNIEHIVHKQDDKICIGSVYCSELISIDMDGQIKHSSIVEPNKGELGQILYALQKMPPEKLRALIMEPEIFGTTKTVYTELSRGRIKAVQCEEYGWPNVTVTGELMYDNSHFKKRKEALSHAKANNISAVKNCAQTLVRKAKETIERLCWLLGSVCCLLRLVFFRGY